MTTGVVPAVLAFGRRLRAEGLPADPGRSRSAAAALTYVDLFDPRDFYYTLRTFLVNSPDQIAVFNRIYRSFWRWPNASGAGPVPPPTEHRPNVSAAADDGHPPEEEWVHTLAQASAAAGESSAEAGSGTALPGDAEASEGPGDARVPGYLNPAALWSVSATDAGVVQVVGQIIEQLSLRNGRRYRVAARGARLDLRRTLRLAVRFGGRPMRLPRRRRKPQTPRIVLLCDVSHSMEAHSVFVLRVVHSFHHQRARIESFVFSVDLLRVTPYLRRWNLPQAVRRIVDDFPYWSGGTRIGECLAAFQQRYARQLLNRRTALVLMTDGITVSDAGLVGRMLQRLADRAGAVLWLNPLIGEPDYDATATSVGRALDCIDVVAPMRDVATLKGLAERLRGRPEGLAGAVPATLRRSRAGSRRAAPGPS